MPKVQKKSVADVLGGTNDWIKSSDLVDHTFRIISFDSTEVPGYITPATAVQVQVGKEEMQWTTFSDVILQQLTNLKKEKLLPCEVTLVEVKSKTNKGKSYLCLQSPEEE